MSWFQVRPKHGTCGISSLFFLFLLGLSSAYSGETKPNWKEVLSAARREGRVVIYGSGGIDRIKLYKERFEAAIPGITVDYLPLGPAQVSLRILAERRAGKHIPDISVGGAGGSTVTPLRAQGALQPLNSALLLPEVLDKSKWFEGRHWFMDNEEKYVLTYALTPGTIVTYNTKLVNPKEIKSYKQLLDGKWRGKILSSDLLSPGGPGGGTVKFVYANPELGPDFLRRLYGEMDVTLSRDYRQLVDWLARGRFAFLLFVGLDDIDKAREQGLPVDVLDLRNMKEGYPLTSGWNSIVSMNPAPHPNAALVFINWLLSREAQTAFEQIMGIASLRTDTTTKGTLRESLVPKKESKYMVVSLEKYWYLDSEIRNLVASVVNKP